MNSSDTQVATNSLSPLNTATCTHGETVTDDQLVTNSFLTRTSFGGPDDTVEDDSTDIYRFERCSPLNDF